MLIFFKCSHLVLVNVAVDSPTGSTEILDSSRLENTSPTFIESEHLDYEVSDNEFDGKFMRS